MWTGREPGKYLTQLAALALAAGHRPALLASNQTQSQVVYCRFPDSYLIISVYAFGANNLDRLRQAWLSHRLGRGPGLLTIERWRGGLENFRPTFDRSSLRPGRQAFRSFRFAMTVLVDFRVWEVCDIPS